eukprot:TRINITY_DN3919_c0_g1_i3.p2 TRINITY_DN3919_c0_g1~~TRINITY_DN3919_c0_g1_i3.p2  ORF type:complete len:148 (-),score=37.06 TRINITY_DN3919_c0_g1_i3:40-483(-)
MELIFFFFKQKTAYEIMPSLVGSEMCIRDRVLISGTKGKSQLNSISFQTKNGLVAEYGNKQTGKKFSIKMNQTNSIGSLSQKYSTTFSSETCLLYTSDAADDMQCVDLGGRRIIKKKKDWNSRTGRVINLKRGRIYSYRIKGYSAEH